MAHLGGGLTVSTEYAVPWYLASACTLKSLRIFVNTVQAGMVCRFGIRQDNAGLPGTLILDVGTLDCSTNNNKAIALTQALSAGRVWISTTIQGAGSSPTLQNMKLIGTSLLPLITSNPAAVTPANSYSQTGVTGALPSTWTGSTLANGVNSGEIIRVVAGF